MRARPLTPRDTLEAHVRAIAALLPTAQAWIAASVLAYLLNGPRPLRPETVRGYLRRITYFLEQSGADCQTPIEDLVTRAHLVRILAQISYERTSERRILVFAVKALARALEELELIPAERAETIASLRFRAASRPERLYLTVEQIERVIVALLSMGGYEILERLINVAIFATLAATGIRSSELCGLTLGDVDFERGVIRVKEGKGGKPRTLGLPKRLEPLLKTYLSHRPSSESNAFFVGPGGRALNRDLLVRRFARISKITGIKVTVHSLRRSFATAIAHRNVPLDKLQVILGHSSLAMTRIYVQTNNDLVAQEMRDW